jgi:hypothetical protein
MALDAGLLYKELFPGLKLGASVQNIGLIPLRPDEELPMAVAVGAAYTMQVFRNDLNLLTDIRLPNDNDPRLGVGAEYWLGGIVAGRIGYNTFSKMSLGLGVSLMGLVADYAYVPFGELGVTHRFSVGYVFDFARSKPAEKKVEKTEVRREPLDFNFAELQRTEQIREESFTAASSMPVMYAEPTEDVLSLFNF